MFDFDGFVTKRKETTLNLTAMIDIIMVLLLFFITTTSFSKLGVKIQQPSSSHATLVDRRDVAEIGIKKDGQLVYNNNDISEDDLSQVIKIVLQTNPETVMVLNPDRDTPTQYLVDAIDVCKEAGIQKISIAAKKKNDDSSL